VIIGEKTRILAILICSLKLWFRVFSTVLRIGSSTEILAPRRGRLAISNLPPSRVTRSRLPPDEGARFLECSFQLEADVILAVQP